MKNIQEIKSSKVIVRVDYNVPIKNGRITDFTRIQKSLPTIQTLLQNNNKIAICSHLGRPDPNLPQDSEKNTKLSFANLIDQISKNLNIELKLISHYPSPDLHLDLKNLQKNQILLLENTRFYSEEKENNTIFTKQLAEPFDYFVFDAFGTAHRQHATTIGLTKFLPSTFGTLVQTEIQELNLGLNNPQKPLTLFLGGAKIKTKIGIIETFLDTADYICIGGALANTFLYAVGYELGQSLIEQEETATAIKIINKAKTHHANLVLPIDLTTKSGEHKSIIDFQPNDSGLDIGPLTTARFSNLIKKSQTIIFNGPMGVYQDNLYSNGTESILKEISKSKTTSILGGGDTLDAIAKYAINPNSYTHVSTGGGAMLKYLEQNGDLPVLKAIQSQS
jgi:3-phosphoglycerate kinase